MERPQDRFRLNEGAKEHRLRKMRGRLDAATPKKKAGRSGLRLLGAMVLALMAWVIWYRPA